MASHREPPERNDLGVLWQRSGLQSGDSGYTQNNSRRFRWECMANVRELQAPLRARYKADPSTAVVIDRARSAAYELADPFHASVVPQGSSEASVVATHRGHGGPHDAATPGDVLCAALACCHELTIRMVANMMGLELTLLEVEVEGDIDLRGSLGVPAVPVGFLRMRTLTRVGVRTGGQSEIDKLMAVSQKCCVVGQTLSAGVTIEHELAT